MAMTRATSFHGYPGGDTQPLDSQVYRDYTESMINPATTTPKKAVLQISPDGKTYTCGTAATERTPKTFVDGETGFIDLEHAWQPVSPTPGAASSHFDGSPKSPPEYTVNSVRSPTVHSSAVCKRKLVSASSEPNVSERKRPAFSQLFNNAGDTSNMLSATQLFHQTQAPSSPLPQGPRSDPIMTRPSPILHNHFSVSSPNIAMSSPIATLHSRPSTSAGEPRDRYTSMRESQEQRTARVRRKFELRQEHQDDMLFEDNGLDEDIERRKFESKRLQRVMSDHAQQEWAKVRANRRLGSYSTSSPKLPHAIDLVTPATFKEKRLDFEVSDDNRDDAEDQVVDIQDAFEPGSSDDEYDELGQTVLRSQVYPEDSEVEDEGASINAGDHDRGNREQAWAVPDGGVPVLEQPGVVELELVHPSLLQTTQQSAVVDSQPANSQREALQTLPRPTNGVSTMSSCIPSSQYREETSEARARYAATARSPDTDRSLMPSNAATREPGASSPLPKADNDTLPDNSAELSVARRHFLVQFQQQLDVSPATEDEIPESDLPDLVVEQSSSRPATSDEVNPVDSNQLNFFSTAQTHISASDCSPQKRALLKSPVKIVLSQTSSIASQSPRAAAGVRRFREIAAAQSPPPASAEQAVDIDAIMSDVITTEDRQFFETVSSLAQLGPSKRRRLEHKRTRNAGTATGLDDEHMAANVEAAVVRTQPRSIIDEAVFPVELRTRASSNATVKALQDHPHKANELRGTTPSPEEMPTCTPESVKKREAAGAKAVSDSLAARAAKSLKHRSLVRIGQKSKASRHAKGRIATSSSTPPTKAFRSQSKSPKTVGPAALDEPTNLHLGNSDAADIDSSTSAASNRVFALFKGSPPNFYPATIVGLSSTGTGYHVKFDDETTSVVEMHHACRLDLRVGDQVKVDGPNMRTKTWSVHGFGPVCHDDDEAILATDVRRRSSVRLRVSSTRSISSVDHKTLDPQDDIFEIPISHIYLTHTMWTRFQARKVEAPAALPTVSKRPLTPLIEMPTSNDNTPGSKLRRSTASTARATSARASLLTRDSTTIPVTPTTRGVFSGMAFAISYSSDDSEKIEICRLIKRNGGLILESGFEELFQLSDMDGSRPSTPRKRSPCAKDAAVKVEQTGLRLHTSFKELGFVALIADRHSRRAKYVQALALGLPTLSGRWISDSVKASTGPNASGSDAVPLPWARYLLSAGESAYLGGAVRSRTMTVYNSTDARLANIIEYRDRLLNGENVLIVATKKGKGSWEKRKAYAFLSLALGAACVKRVSDLREAKALLHAEKETWKWVYVEGSVADASAVLFDSTTAGTKKRKRDEHAGKAGPKAMSAGNGRVKIVNDEFVVQSLILGALIE